MFGCFLRGNNIGLLDSIGNITSFTIDGVESIAGGIGNVAGGAVDMAGTALGSAIDGVAGVVDFVTENPGTALLFAGATATTAGFSTLCL